MKKRRILAAFLAIFTSITIFYVSSITFSSSTGPDYFNLKPLIYHIGIFFFLSIYLHLAVDKPRLILLTISILVIYAILDEMHQFFVPGRAATLSDILQDTIGIFFGSIIYTTFR